jgi:hypothetical protein
VQKTKCEHQITQLDAIFAAGKFIGTDDDETKVLKAIDILEDYEFELKDLSTNTKLYIFNNNCIELSRIDDKSIENRLNYYVYCIGLKIGS